MVSTPGRAEVFPIFPFTLTIPDVTIWPPHDGPLAGPAMLSTPTASLGTNDQPVTFIWPPGALAVQLVALTRVREFGVQDNFSRAVTATEAEAESP